MPSDSFWLAAVLDDLISRRRGGGAARFLRLRSGSGHACRLPRAGPEPPRQLPPLRGRLAASPAAGSWRRARKSASNPARRCAAWNRPCSSTIRSSARPTRFPTPPALAWERRHAGVLLGAGVILLAAAIVALIAAGVREPPRSSAAAATSDFLVAIDPATNRVARRFPVGDTPTVVSVGAGAAWTVDADSRTVSRVDLRTRTVETLSAGTVPLDIAAGPTPRGWWAGSSAAGEVDYPAGHPHAARPRFGRGCRDDAGSGSLYGPDRIHHRFRSPGGRGERRRGTI